MNPLPTHDFCTVLLRSHLLYSGGEAVFECEAVGNPLPAKFWSKEDDGDVMFPGHISMDGRIKVDDLFDLCCKFTE